MLPPSHIKPQSSTFFFLLLMAFVFANCQGLPVPSKSSKKDTGSSTKPTSLRDAVTARMQQLKDQGRIRNDTPTVGGEQNNTPPRKLTVNNPVQVGLQEVSEQPKGKTTLRKAASALAKIKIMTAIHPRFSAVLLPEQSGETSLPPPQPLTDINYKSSPLRGTEQYDQETVSFKAPVSNPVINDPVKHVDSVQTSTGKVVSKQTIDEVRSHQSGRSGLSNTMSVSSVSAQQPKEESSMKPVGAESISSMQFHKGPKTGDHAREEEKRASVAKEANNGVFGDKKEKRVESFVPEQEAAKKTEDNQKGQENKTISWKAFLNWAKARMSGILKKKDNTQPKFSKKYPVGLMYTENDIKQLANDIIDVIRERSYQTYKQQDYVQTTGNWNEGELTSREYNSGTNGPISAINAKVLVTPDLVSDAVKASAEKLLISKKLSSDTNQYKTSLTGKAQDNRAKPISGGMDV